MSPRICVIGAGIIGVSSAVRVIEAFPGSEVTIVADEFSPHTTSDVAGGFWEPHLLGNTQAEKIKEWSDKTFEYMVNFAFSPLAKQVGANMVSGYQLSSEEPDHMWKDTVYGYRQLTEKELENFPGMRYGVFYTTVMLEQKQYIPWLMKRFVGKGGKIEKHHIKQLSELGGKNFDVIINCTGVGAQHLVGDNNIQPVRGQVLKVEAPWIKQFYVCTGLTDDDIAYILPSTSFVVMGGVEQRGNWDRTASQSDRNLILKNCCHLVPSLKEAKIIEDRAGLRPSRTSVRLELEYISVGDRKQAVVHNYGHGGAGVTLHWGCAENAVKLVKHALESTTARL